MIDTTGNNTVCPAQPFSIPCLFQAYTQNNFINFDGTTFYSDSINDLPLLCAVEKAVGVNPDSKLRHECISRGWEIIDLP